MRAMKRLPSCLRRFAPTLCGFTVASRPLPNVDQLTSTFWQISSPLDGSIGSGCRGSLQPQNFVSSHEHPSFSADVIALKHHQHGLIQAPRTQFRILAGFQASQEFKDEFQAARVWSALFSSKAEQSGEGSSKAASAGYSASELSRKLRNLGFTVDECKAIVAKDSSLNKSFDQARAKELVDTCCSWGLTSSFIAEHCMVSPSFLLKDPEEVGELLGLFINLGVSQEKLMDTLRRGKCLDSMSTVKRKVTILQDCKIDGIGKLIMKVPRIFHYSADRWASNIATLTASFDKEDVPKLIEAQPRALASYPENLSKVVEVLTALLGKDGFKQAVKARPSLLTSNAKVLTGVQELLPEADVVALVQKTPELFQRSWELNVKPVLDLFVNQVDVSPMQVLSTPIWKHSLTPLHSRVQFLMANGVRIVLNRGMMDAPSESTSVTLSSATCPLERFQRKFPSYTGP